MEFKILIAAGIFFLGWFLFYLFGRQLMFNLMTAFPLIKKMQKTQKDLIANTSKSYTLISVIVCIVMLVIFGFIVFRFCPLYLKISFAVGAVLAFCMYVTKLNPENRSSFDSFCNAYYRFVPDDELRTAMFNKKVSQMKIRLHDMELPIDFIPSKFKD